MFKKLSALLLAVIISISVFTSCSGSNKVIIGSKDFTENKILAEIMAQLIEKNSDIKVERKLNMGGTFVCFEALKKVRLIFTRNILAPD